MRRWVTLRMVRLHVAVVFCTVAFVYLADWQVHRALAGNTLSWAYAFEWPLFLGYAWILWWRLVADELGISARSGTRLLPFAGLFADRRARRAAGRRAVEDDELARYNAYLASLSDRRSGPASGSESEAGSRR